MREKKNGRARHISLAYSHINYNPLAQKKERILSSSSPIPLQFRDFILPDDHRRNYRLDLPKSLLIRRTTGHVCFLLRDRGTDTSSAAFPNQKRSINPYKVKLELNLTATRSRRTRAFDVNAKGKRATISLAHLDLSEPLSRCVCNCGSKLFTVFSRALSPLATGNDRDAGWRSIV